MKFVVVLIIALLAPLAAAAETLQCTVTDGAHKAPGELKLVDVAERDKSITGSVFMVSRPAGQILGSAVFSNDQFEITVLRNVDDIINVFVVLSVDKSGDSTILTIKDFEGSLTFHFHAAYLGLFLIGECTVL